MAYYFFLSHMTDNEIFMHVKISNFFKLLYYYFSHNLHNNKNTIIGFRLY